MHPMAVYCALKGLAAYQRRPQSAPVRLYELRIYRPPLRRGSRGLGPVSEAASWVALGCNGPEYYREIPWDEIPEAALDRLPQKLVDSLCDAICS